MVERWDERYGEGAGTSPAPRVPGSGSGGGQDRYVPERHVPRQGGPADSAGLFGGPPDFELEGPVSDAELLSRVRSGDDSAYEELYRRHADSVRRYARSCCRDPHTAEDLTGEVFARTLQAVRGGSGPDVAVRAYLLTTVRRVAAAWATTARREQLVEDFALFAVSAAGAAAAARSGGPGSASESADVRAMREADRSMAVRAFRSLPERWQAVLWHTAVEQESPSQIAPLLGLTANATAVLAHRAREGLRQAYLQAHVSEALTGQARCGRYADRLGAYARGALRLRANRELRRHLDGCARCRAAYLELADVNACLRGLLPAAFIGWFAATYAAKAAAVATGAGAASVGAGAVAGAAAASGGSTSAGAGGGGAAGGAGGASGGTTAGGLSVPAKFAIGTGAVAVAVAVAAAITTMGDEQPPQVPSARPPASAPPAEAAAPPGPHKSAPRQPEREAKPAPAERGPGSTPSAAPVQAEAESARPEPRTPNPTTTPTSPPAKPGPKPPPVPLPTAVFPVHRLDWSLLGDNGDEPTIRLAESGFVWRRSSMSVGGTRYGEGGVTVYPVSGVVIDLNRSCRALDASVGIDDLSAGLGSVRFEVYGDGQRLYRSPPVREGQDALPVHVNLSGYKTVRLVAAPSGLASPGRLADWANARISC